ncbi:hypothetical protein, partial [Rhizobium wenxiniae]|uniref:hypothetical protein n=1 Tax=Rhizobium wenxiniae TaxID=1737357 RepID=UPI003C141A59
TEPNRNPAPSAFQPTFQQFFLDFSRTKDIVASSAAALVSERVIVPPPRKRQQAHFEILQKNDKQMISLRNFEIFLNSADLHQPIPLYILAN